MDKQNKRSIHLFTNFEIPKDLVWRIDKNLQNWFSGLEIFVHDIIASVLQHFENLPDFESRSPNIMGFILRAHAWEISLIISAVSNFTCFHVEDLPTPEIIISKCIEFHEFDNMFSEGVVVFLLVHCLEINQNYAWEEETPNTSWISFWHASNSERTFENENQILEFWVVTVNFLYVFQLFNAISLVHRYIDLDSFVHELYQRNFRFSDIFNVFEKGTVLPVRQHPMNFVVGLSQFEIIISQHCDIDVAIWQI